MKQERVMEGIICDTSVGLNNFRFVLFFSKLLYLHITYGGLFLSFN